MLPHMVEDNVKSEEINPLDSRHVDIIAILKPDHYLTKSVALLQKENSWCIKGLKLFQEDKENNIR